MRSKKEAQLKKVALLLIVSMLVPFALACGGKDNDENGSTGSDPDVASGAVTGAAAGRQESPGSRRRGARASASRASRPSIRILTPADGQTVHGDALNVSVSVKGFRVVAQRVRPPFPPPVAGKGHVHFYLDTETLPKTHSPPTTGTYRSLSTTRHTWTSVPAGRHTLAVQLVGKDHAPLSSPVKDRITVTVM